jgi:predicted GNAT family acetyltransferase
MLSLALECTTLTEEQMQFGEEVGADFMRIAEEPPGVFEGTLSEIGKGLVRGGIVEPSRFVKENFNLYDPLVFQVVDPRTGEFDPQLRIVSREEKAEIDRAIAAGEMPYAVDFEQLFERGDAAETGPGAAMLGDIAQFMGAYAGVGKLFRIGKGITGGMTQGAAADFFGFGGDEGRITDLLLELGVPDNMVTDFLRTDPNDPDYVGRFKNALEGGVLGGLIEQIGPVYRLIKEGGSRTQLGQAIGDLRARSEQSFANTISDVIGTGRAVAQGDTEMLGEIFQPAGTPRSLGAAAPNLEVSRRDASNIFGEGAERVRYTDPQSGGTIEVVARPDGTASVLELEVPEQFRGQGIGQNLQERVMQDFPMMGGQVSSKAAATTAYRLGRRPVGKPNATLEDVFAEIDDMSSVNMVSPEMQRSLGAAGTGVDDAALVGRTEDFLGQAAIIRQDDVYRGEGTPRITVRETNEPFVVRGTQQSQIDDMIQSGLVRPKPGGYGANNSAQLYFGESSEALPTSIFGRPSEERFVLVGDSDKLAGTEGPIPIDQLRHVWAVRDGETVDILPEGSKNGNRSDSACRRTGPTPGSCSPGRAD